MRRLGLAIAIVLVVAAAVSAAPPGPIRDVPIYVNYASFGNTFGGADPTRVIDTGLGAWADYGSSRNRLYVAGSTNYAGCSVGNPSHIWASTTGICDDPNCPACNCTIAEWQNCTFGGYSVVVNIRDFTFALGAATGSQKDFQHVVTHENGHWLLNPNGQDGHGHVDGGTDCVMQPGGLPNPLGRYFCQADMQQMDWWSGHANDVFKYSSNPNYYDPVGTQWTPRATLPTSASFDWGFGTIEKGLVMPGSILRDSVFYANSSLSLRLDDYRPVFGTYPGPNIPVRRKPAVIFSPYDSKWVMFALEDNDVPHVKVFTSPDRVAWTDKGYLREQNFGHIISTRSPVAVAVDPYSNKLVVVVTYWGEDCFSGFGCSDTLNVFIVDPAQGYTPTAVHTTLTGYTAFGAPVVICADSKNAQGMQCAVAVTGTDPQRMIWTFDLGVSSTGTVTAAGANTIGGWTNMQMSGHQQIAGPLVLAVAGTDTVVYLSKRTSMSSWWGSWVPATATSGGALTTRLGPSFRGFVGDITYYDLLLTP